MPDEKPPPLSVRITPSFRMLPAGTELWRVHSARYGATQYREDPADLHWDGGRFCDIRDGLHEAASPYLYAAWTRRAALLETVAAGLTAGSEPSRRITLKSIEQKVLSKVTVRRSVPLVDLSTLEALDAVRQDHWLIDGEADRYPLTRRWGSWIRAQAPTAAGFYWETRRELSRAGVVVLYLRPPFLDVLESHEKPVALKTAQGRALVRQELERLNIRVNEPSRNPIRNLIDWAQG